MSKLKPELEPMPAQQASDVAAMLSCVAEVARASVVMPRRQTLRQASAWAVGALTGIVGGVPRALAAPRAVDDLPITLELPDDWIPIPRAEIVEATERARTEGAAIDWQMRAAWQRVPHLRWFTLPHMLLESQPAADATRRAAKVEHSVGRAGSRSVYTHRAVWARDGLALRLTLLSWEDERAMFETWIASLRDGGQPLAIER